MGRKNDDIIIAQVNSNSVGNKKNEIEKLLHDRNISVLCLNDTRLTKSKKIRFNGYKLLRKDNQVRRHKAGGVAILVKNGFKAFEVDTGNSSEFLAVDVKFGHLNVRVATAYLHPGQLATQRHFDVL